MCVIQRICADVLLVVTGSQKTGWRDQVQRKKVTMYGHCTVTHCHIDHIQTSMTKLHSPCSRLVDAKAPGCELCFDFFRPPPSVASMPRVYFFSLNLCSRKFIHPEEDTFFRAVLLQLRSGAFQETGLWVSATAEPGS